MRKLILCLLILSSLGWAQNPNTAAFPSTAATDSDLFVAANNGSTALNTTINNSTTTIILTSGTKFTAPVVIGIDSEIIHCTTLTTNTLTGCTRGLEGTTATSHTAPILVYNIISAWHHNQIAAEVKAIETHLPSFTGLRQANGSSADTAATAIGSAVTGTTQTACDNSTKLATTAYTGTACNLVKTSGSPFTITAQSQTIWNDTASTYVGNLPATTSGIQICIGNYKTRSSAVSLVPPSGSTIYYKGIAGTTSSSTGLVSPATAGDFICVEAVDSTTWIAIGAGTTGTWTNN